MAQYFHVTTPTGTTTTKVPTGWLPSIQGGLLVLPDGTEIEASAITNSRFESKRETPARDAKVKDVELAQAAFDEGFALLGCTMEVFLDAHSAYSALLNTKLALAAHDDNVQRSKEAARQKKANPPTPKPKAPVKAKPSKK